MFHSSIVIHFSLFSMDTLIPSFIHSLSHSYHHPCFIHQSSYTFPFFPWTLSFLHSSTHSLIPITIHVSFINRHTLFPFFHGHSHSFIHPLTLSFLSPSMFHSSIVIHFSLFSMDTLI